ncbi:hypothetical protein K438DRAFT_1749087 [Mycena galopus ATCC 62051]|nr:hypothetical protein K438DRAFT_1749087 [Mycena galopus ATCC 62051]
MAFFQFRFEKELNHEKTVEFPRFNLEALPRRSLAIRGLRFILVINILENPCVGTAGLLMDCPLGETDYFGKLLRRECWRRDGNEYDIRTPGTVGDAPSSFTECVDVAKAPFSSLCGFFLWKNIITMRKDTQEKIIRSSRFDLEYAVRRRRSL